MLDEGNLYHRDGIIYKVISYKWLSSLLVNIVFEQQSPNKENILFSGSAAQFISQFSLLPKNLELVKN